MKEDIYCNCVECWKTRLQNLKVSDYMMRGVEVVNPAFSTDPVKFPYKLEGAE